MIRQFVDIQRRVEVRRVVQIEDPHVEGLPEGHQAEPHEGDVLGGLGEVRLRREDDDRRGVPGQHDVENESVGVDAPGHVDRVLDRDSAAGVEHVRVQKLRPRRAVGLQHCVSQGTEPRRNPECDHVVVPEDYTRERGSRRSRTSLAIR